MTSDQRDGDIARYAFRRSAGFYLAAVVGALALSMLEVDPFWVGSVVFVLAALGSMAEAGFRLRAYRRGFDR